MRKTGWIIIGSVVGVIILLWVVATLVIGAGFENGMKQALTEAETSSGGSISSIELMEFNKGMGTSIGKTKMVIGSPGVEGVEVFLNHKIFHGPLMMTPSGMKFGTSHVVTTLDIDSLPEEAKKNIEHGFTTPTPLVINTTTSFSSANQEVKIAPYNNRIEGKDGDSVRVIFDGLEGKITGMGDSKMKGEMTMGELKISAGEDFVMKLEAGKGAANNYTAVDGMMTDGEVKAEFPRLTITNDGNTIRVRDLMFLQKSESANGAVSVKQTVTTSDIALPGGDEFADAKSLISKGVEWEFTMAKLNLETLKKVGEASKALKRKQAAAGNDSEAAQKLAMQQGKLALELVTPGAEIKTKLDLRGEAGRSTIDFGLHWVAGEPLLKMSDVKQLISGLKIELKALLPIGLMENPKMAKMIEMAAAQKGLIIGEDKIEGSAMLIHSTATLNDEVFPLADMLGPMGEMPLDWDAIFSGKTMGAGAGAGSNPPAPPAVTPKPAATPEKEN